MRILLTGCAGFIGSHLSEYLLSQGHEVTGLDNFDTFYSKELKLKNLSIAKQNKNFSFLEFDITNKSPFTKLPKNIDAIIHLAAKAGVRPSIEDPVGYNNTNIIGTLNILEWMKENEIKNLVFASSSSVYGNNKKIPFSETDSVDAPISPYAYTKKAGELLTHTYHHLYGINVANLRFFTVFGPRQRPDLAIRKFIELINANKPVHLFGDGSTARDYTFISDIVNGIYGSLNYVTSHKNVYEIINLGNNSPVKLNDMVSIICKALGKTPDIVYDPMQPGDVDITYADITKAGKLLNYKPGISFEEGIRRFIEWQKQ